MGRLLVVIVIICVTVTLAKPPNKIKGGELADQAEFPWQVSLRIKHRHVCSGSIIDKTHILTAAHCIKERDGTLTKGIEVLVGTNNARQWFPMTHKVKSLHPNSGYSGVAPYRYDIAIITLATPIEFNERQQPIALPGQDLSVGDEVIVSGWGVTNFPAKSSDFPSALMKMAKKIVSNAHCKREHNIIIHPDQLCAYAQYGKGICIGDSGSGLINNGAIVGIASWVKPCGVGRPDVYTRVYAHKAWIAETIAANP